MRFLSIPGLVDSVVLDSLPVDDIGWKSFISFLWESVLNATHCVSGKHTNSASEQRQ